VDASPHGPIEAKLVGVDRVSDLAVLKIDVKGLPTLQLADSNNLRQGQVVFAFGSPLGLENSVSMGVVSATSRLIDPDKPTSTYRRTRPSIPATAEVRWWMWMPCGGDQHLHSVGVRRQ